VVFYYQADNT